MSCVLPTIHGNLTLRLLRWKHTVWPNGLIVIQCLFIYNRKVATNKQHWQSRFKILSNKITLSYWQRFMKFRQSGEILPNLVTLSLHSNKTFSRWTGGSDAWCQCSSSSTDDRERDAKGEASLEGWSHQRDHHLGGGGARWKLQEDQKGNLGLILQTVYHQRYCIHFNDMSGNRVVA